MNFAVGLSFALIAALTAGYIYEKRDFIFEWDWARTHGKFETVVPPQLVVAARDLAEKSRPGEACVAKPLGRDERFLYMAIGCGKFDGVPKDPKASGGEAFSAARLRVSGNSVSDLEQPLREALPNSLHRLIPLKAYEKMRYGFPPSDFFDEGLQRMKAKNLASSSDIPR